MDPIKTGEPIRTRCRQRRGSAPNGAATVRLPRVTHGTLFWHGTRHGLFCPSL